MKRIVCTRRHTAQRPQLLSCSDKSYAAKIIIDVNTFGVNSISLENA